MRYYTVQEVEAVQWTSEVTYPLPFTQGVGCQVCYPNVCPSSAHHLPTPHFHHLWLQTERGTVTVFSGDWIVTYKDGRRERVPDAEFRHRFSAHGVDLVYPREVLPEWNEKPKASVQASESVTYVTVEE